MRIAGVLLVSLWIVPAALPAQAGAPTEVVVLGVDHSNQLVAEASQPAALRAFIDRVKPAAICIEREPESYARGEFYEFTYEQQEIVVPYARERGIPVWPVDWEPPVEDMKLAFGQSLDETPLVRPASGYLSFLSFPDPDALGRGLLAAESRDFDPAGQLWIATPAAKPRQDFPRRMFLYRTFLQAMRIAGVAKRYPGKRVLVVVGWLHKRDIEGILGGEAGIVLVPPGQMGGPGARQVTAAIRDKDLEDVLAFNLLGVQGSTGNVNWTWMRRSIAELRRRRPSAASIALFEIRLGVLIGAINSTSAVSRYERAAATVPKEVSLGWTGRNDSRRLDSFFDPFAGLTVAQRLRLERARELAKLGQAAESRRVRDELAAQLGGTRALQLHAYWDEFVVRRN